jgi:hypothetical protein
MKRHSALQELLDNPKIAAVSKLATRKKAVDILRVAFPEKQAIVSEAHRWADTLFPAFAKYDPRAEPVELHNRLVLRHPEALRVRAYYASGTIEYRNLRRACSGETAIKDPAKAARIVESFAAQHQLWPAEAPNEPQLEAVRFVKSCGMKARGERSRIVTNNVITIYRRQTNDLPWVGRGSRIVAMIGVEDVVDFQRHWRPVLPGAVASVKLLPVEKALEAMLEDLSGRTGGGEIKAGELDLVRADLGYFAAGKHRFQRLIQPVYIFAYRPRNGFSTNGFVFGTYAHEEKFEAILPTPAPAFTRDKRERETTPQPLRPNVLFRA